MAWDKDNPAAPGSARGARITNQSTTRGQGTTPAGSVQAIEVLSIRRLDGSGNVKAFASIRIGEITIHGAKIVQQDGQKEWLAPPDKPWTGRDGEQKWSPVVELTKPLRLRVEAVVLDAWERGR